VVVLEVAKTRSAQVTGADPDLGDTQESLDTLIPGVPSVTSAQTQEATREIPTGHAGLLVRTGSLEGTIYDVTDHIVVGRHPASGIFLNDITVSRRHAEVRREGDFYLISDLGSLNGTYLNGDRVEEGELKPGDELQIGKFRFVFLAQP
jgi:pSer/pThr/pTyr-binding forkhead associated (FHA) protein